jgi:hypothetical protein
LADLHVVAVDLMESAVSELNQIRSFFQEGWSLRSLRVGAGFACRRKDIDHNGPRPFRGLWFDDNLRIALEDTAHLGLDSGGQASDENGIRGESNLIDWAHGHSGSWIGSAKAKFGQASEEAGLRFMATGSEATLT